MQWLLRLLPGPQTLIIRYSATAVMVFVTFAARLAMGETAGPYGFILYVPAILVAALLFDRGSGFLALALSAALTASIVQWENNVGIHLAALMIFAAISALVVIIAEGLHRALEEAHEARRGQALLLAEMTHRVRNKFAMILSLIGLQARQSQPETQQALEAVAQRVRVIANMHEHLQIARHDNLVEISEYLGELCRSLQDAIRELRPVTVTVNSQPVRLEPGMALSIGLIANELVVNAFKYAFADGRAGRVSVECKAADGLIQLSVADDGVGCPENSEPGLGTRLIALLVDQLGGAIKRERLDPGCRVWVTIPIPAAKPT
jgi:two-component sensor histidine kinase